MDEATVVEAYWRNWALSRGDRAARLLSNDSFWAWHAVEEMVATDSDELVDVLERLADAAPSDEALAYLGAGPINDLLQHASPAVLAQWNERSRRSPRLTSAAKHAW